MKRILLLTLLVAAGLACGYISEMLKVNLNYRIDVAQRISGYDQMTAFQKNAAVAEFNSLINAPFDYYYSHARIGALSHLSIRELNMLKWLSTFFFIAVFCCLNFFLLKLATADSPLRKMLLPSYALLFVAALAIYGIASLAGSPQTGYTLSREIAGLLQSMIPAMVLYLAHLISIRTTHGTNIRI